VADAALVGVGFGVQQGLGGDQEAGRADPALQGGVFEEGLLKGVQPLRRGHPFDGLDFFALGLDAQNETGIDDTPVEIDGASAAVAVVAALFGASESNHVPEHFEQALARLAEEVHMLAVDYGLYIGLSGHF
jgi:hypothetical protein